MKKSYKIEKGVKSIIEGLNCEFNLKELENDVKSTPSRVAETLREMFKGYDIPEKQLKELLKPIYNSGYIGMLTQANCVAFSLCPHHLLPIKYSFAVSYIPKKNMVVGLSKLAHLCGYYAKRPMLQENMTSKIADSIMKYIKPHGCAVVVIGKHTCINLGAGETQAPEFKNLNSTNRDDIINTTTELRGNYKEPEVKNEFFNSINGWIEKEGRI